MNGWQRRFVFILVMLNVSLHFGDLPFWIPALGLLFVVWRWLADIYQIPCPGRFGAAAFALAATCGVWAEFSRLIGDPASTALLVIMISLKTFEIRGYRDLMIVTYLCLLLLMAKLLSSQTVAIAIFMFVDVIAILALMHLYHLPHKTRGIPWRRAGRLVLHAAPIFLVLFFLFPRFNFSFFKRQAEQVHSVGFAGQIRPGSIERLTKSDEVAFRAFFRGGMQPPYSQLYWRGAVLDKVDGMNWDPSPAPHKPPSLVVADNSVEIMIESGDSPWLFTLDWPVSVQMGSSYRQEQLEESTGLSYSLRTPLIARETYAVNYQAVSRELVWDQEEPKNSKEVATPGRQLRALLQRWRAAHGNPLQAVKSIQEYFIENKFTYQLRAASSGDLEEFLFRTKSGYCEHFAGSVATLLRHLDIPARVIVGYHGGTPSLMGDYLLIYQRDAHAWVEYWDKSRNSWLRLDPTAWVEVDTRSNLRQGFAAWQNNPIGKWLGVDLANLWRRSGLILDQIEIVWVTFMLRYDFSYQQKLFSKWGFARVTRWGLFAFSVFAVLILGLMAYVLLRLNRRSLPRDQELESYQRMCRQLGKAGLWRKANEGPYSLMIRAQQRWPEQADKIAELFGTWMNMRYGSVSVREKASRQWHRLSKKLTLHSDAGARQD